MIQLTKKGGIDLNQPANRLDSLVNTLYDKDPFWSKCLHCPFQGKCCNGANINVFPYEIPIIITYLKQCSLEDRLTLKNNIINNRYCPFQFEKKCLIHECRPLNCRWTPFKMQWNNLQNANYYLSDVLCDSFTYNEIDIDFYENIDNPYIQVNSRLFLNLDNFLRLEGLFLKDFISLSDYLRDHLFLLD